MTLSTQPEQQEWLRDNTSQSPDLKMAVHLLPPQYPQISCLKLVFVWKVFDFFFLS